ncbi:hypothetical protein [Streptomyces shenzhenensis]|uniref:Uncharacterized protein n=1 Tax=Streptomyces shenzhenensis TaxID=943815 RepID=A0A3M0IA62_9ACTN|nr:hypothetical protein [Streptomyces shenzhenensis]RMB83663.1 hypothetical protein CTZ28_23385 [Streptomyces shenzhenensis]
MSAKPFDFELAEKKLTDGFIDELLKHAEQFRAVRDVIREGSDSLDRRLARAGLVRREWRETEESLPSLITEARDNGHSVDGIAYTLGVTESYVYRILRKSRSAKDQ